MNTSTAIEEERFLRCHEAVRDCHVPNLAILCVFIDLNETSPPVFRFDSLQRW